MKNILGSSIEYDSIARNNMAKGVYAVADLVQTTMGPRGKNVIIQKGNGYPIITKDGVTVARFISLSESAQSVGVKKCKEVAQKTDDLVGDGTTTSIVLFAAMVRLGIKLIEAGYSPVDLRCGMFMAMELACEKLNELSIPVDSIDKILNVSTISSKDKKIGNLIAGAIDKVGMDGIITVRASQQQNSFVEVSSGMEIEKGYITPNFITKGERMEVELDNAYVFMTDCPITEVSEVEKLIKWCVDNKKSLLLIANDIRRDALGAFINAKKSGRINGVAIQAPRSGQDRLDILDDIGVYTGGSTVSATLGSSLNSCKISVCGKADRVVVNGRKTIITGGKGKEEEIEKRIKQIKYLESISKANEEKKSLNNRIANLLGGVAVIKAGGATEIEMQETKYRVEDGVNAAQASIKSGIIPGGGKATWWIAQQLKNELNSLSQKNNSDNNEGIKRGYEIIINALEEPINQILKNANMDITQVIKSIKQVDPWIGYDLINNQVIDMQKEGIVDPTLVTTTALKNSVSGASLILTCEALVGKVH